MRSRAGEERMILVDSHLDIAFGNVCFGRDPRLSALETRAREGEKANEMLRGHCMVGLPELRAGRVAIVGSTLFSAPRDAWRGKGDVERATYASAAEAQDRARSQLAFYEELVAADVGFRLVRTQAELESVIATWEDEATGDVGLVPLMEGADPVVVPEDAARWFEDGVRIVGLTWSQGSRYAGGNAAPGPLTAAGRRLLPSLAESGFIVDLSHASEESCRDVLDSFEGALVASHSNPRRICAGERQLSDAVIRGLAERGGMIGIVPFAGHLVDHWYESGRPAVPLQRVGEAIHSAAEIAGTHRVIGIGSDFDGGFGAEGTPAGLDTVADLPRLADTMADFGFGDEMVYDILGRNWIRFLLRTLPAA
jgi:membrane dipeptidase